MINENDSVAGNEFIKKSSVLQTMTIADAIVKNNLNFKRLSQYPDALDNKQRYNGIILPLIEEFKEMYAYSPNVLLDRFLIN